MSKMYEALTRAYQEVINPQPIEESHFKVGDKVEYEAEDGGEYEGEVVKVDSPEEGAYYTVKLENGKTVKAKPEQLEAEDEDEDEDEEEMKEALDPVDPKELKGKHKDRKDKDLNNDGKVDGTDEYLHNRRKTISKKVKGEDDPKGNKGETATMNPKMNSGKTEQKESFRDKLLSVLERTDKHTAGATPPESMDDQYKGGGAKKMKDDHKAEVQADATKATDDNAKAEKQAKISPKNPTDKGAPGDANIINPVQDITKQGGFAQMVKSIADAYKGMK